MTRRHPDQLTFDFGEGGLSPIASSIARERPKAELIPFPLTRRSALVVKLAGLVISASTSSAGENLLRGRLARLARGLRRKHVSEQVIAGELRGLEEVVRVALSRMGRRANG